MCGVFGIYSCHSKVSINIFHSALELLKHRGPDHQGFFVSNSQKLLLGHTRLSILDPSSKANQPMKRGSFTISYNGEIYNHQRLRENLSAEFNTTSDTETLLYGLKEQGYKFFSQCLGMYAGAFYEEEKQELTLFRDPLGIKNIFYYKADELIIFSSEIKSIFKVLNDIKSTVNVDHETLIEYITFENYAQGRTLFKNIYSLLPGQIITIDADINIHLNKIEPFIKSYSFNPVTYISDGRQVIENSVRRHLLSDFPIGVYLSGGIDSSLIASLAVKNQADIIAFTGFFTGQTGYYDERPYSRLVADHLKLELHEVEISPNHFESRFDKSIYHLETPKMGMGTFAQFIVAETAAKFRRVILAGHGGDELFAGYPMFKAFWMAENFGKIPRVTTKELPWIIYFFLNKFLKKKVYFAPQIFKNHQVGKGTFWEETKDGNLQKLFHYYQSCYIPGLLEVEDRISMSHSLETRVPLWDLEVINFSQTIPIKTKLQNGVLKGVLREIAKPYLPAELFKAPKRGFPTPLRAWFKNESFDFIYSRLMQNSNLLDMVMEQQQRKDLLKSLKNKHLPFALDEIRAHKIWMLLCLESVERQFGVGVGTG